MHLEPNYYKWKFTDEGDQVKFRLYYVEKIRSITMPGNNELSETLELEFEGEVKEVFFPLWRGLRELASREIGYQQALSRLTDKVNETR